MTDGLHILELATVRWYNACAEYAVHLAEGLAARGHRVVVGGYPGSPPLEKARQSGLPVLEAFDFRPGRVDAPLTLLRFRRYLEASRFDLINAHRAEDQAWAALALVRRRRIPLVRTRGDVRAPRVNAPNRWLYTRRTDAHVAAGAFMIPRYYAPFGLSAERVLMIPPGIDVEAFRRGVPDRHQARALLDLPRGGRIVGLIGRLTAAKGLFVALEAFSEIRRRLPDLRFVISGEPYDVSIAQLRERAHYLGLESSLTILPRLTDVRPLIRALDAGVVASTASEAICRVALEYQALGVPVVGTDINSVPEIVRHGRTGLIVPAGEAAPLAQAVCRLFAEPALRERLGEAGPAHIRENYSLDACISATESLYRRLLRERRP